MTRFPHLFSLLTGEPDQATQARKQAWLDYKDAKDRGDTRAMHDAQKRLMRETRLELVR